MVTIRHATPADTPQLLELGRHMHAAMVAYSRFLVFDEATIAQRIDELRASGLVLVAELDGVLVGYLGFEYFPGAGLLNEMAWWIEPNVRARSAGPRLLDAAEDWARKKGARVLQMVSPAKSTVGAFLERRGYVAVETLFQMVFPGATARDPSAADSDAEDGAGTRRDRRGRHGRGSDEGTTGQ